MTFPTDSPAKILVVDDTPLNIEILADILESNYDLTIATSGQRALSLLNEGYQPNLILLDVMMPVMDGYDVCCVLKQNVSTQHIPVIFITSNSDSDNETKALSSGAVDFIHKPINATVLRARVQLHLEMERRNTALQQKFFEINEAQSQLQVLSTAIEQSPVSILICTTDGAIQYVNPYFSKETGYTTEEVIGLNPRILKSGLTVPATFSMMWEYLTHGEPWSGEIINRRKSGEVFWQELHIAPVKDAEDKITHYVAAMLDITERKQAHERLDFLAHHDVLTGLPNRTLFFDRIQQGMVQMKRDTGQLALLFIDLDKFKPINDQYGHALGDEVLLEAAQRMKTCVRKSDTVGRIGGDEFVVLLLDVKSVVNATNRAEKFREVLFQPFMVNDKSLFISASIGVALFPEHALTRNELAKHADYAMYYSKQHGGNQVNVYHPSMSEHH